MISLYIYINEEFVRSKLAKLRIDKASGVDNLSPRIWREIKEEICCSSVL